VADADTISILNAQLTKANGEAATRRAQNKELRTKIAAAEASIAGHDRALGTITTERDSWKMKAEAAPTEKDARIAEMEASLRGIVHRAAFDKEATAKGAKAAALDALWAVSQYKAEGDTPDPARITEVVGQLATSQAYAFTPATDATSAKPIPKSVLPPGAGAQRGDPATPPGAYAVRKSDMRSVVWMEKNQAALGAAQKAGTLVVTDD
jgi:hypothetical protein